MREYIVIPHSDLNRLIAGGRDAWERYENMHIYVANDLPYPGYIVVDNTTGDAYCEYYHTWDAARSYIDGMDPCEAYSIDCKRYTHV